MQCKFYSRQGTCSNIADHPYPCCDSYHGFQFKKHLSMAKFYKDGVLKKEELVEGDMIKRPWTEEQLDYYLKLI